MSSIVPNIEVEMKRSLSSSLYWYVEKSLDDMLNEYMLLVKDKQDADVATATEVNQIITQMLELPLEFDSTSRQLSVHLILGSIQRNIIKSTKACKYLLITILKRKSEITGLLKSDFMTLLEEIFFREIKEEYFKPEVEVPLQPQPLQDFNLFEEEEINPKLESRAYAEILVDLYQREIISATQVLVCMDHLSKKKPSYYHAELLLFLLSKVGASVETKLSRGNYTVRFGHVSTPVSSTSGAFTGCRATFESIYKRLESMMQYAVSTESQLAYNKILKGRKAKTKSKDKVKNGSKSHGQNSTKKNNLLLTSSSNTSKVIMSFKRRMEGGDGLQNFPQSLSTMEEVRAEEGVTAL